MKQSEMWRLGAYQPNRTQGRKRNQPKALLRFSLRERLEKSCHPSWKDYGIIATESPLLHSPYTQDTHSLEATGSWSSELCLKFLNSTFFTIKVQMIHIYKPQTIMMMTILPWPDIRCVLICGISLYNTSCYVEHGHVTSNIWMRRPRLGQVLKVTQINGQTKIQTQLSLCPWVIWIAQNLQRSFQPFKF